MLRRYKTATSVSMGRNGTGPIASNVEPGFSNAKLSSLKSRDESGESVKKTSQGNSRHGLPEIRMAYSAYREIMLSIASQKPETGGILLGPIEKGEVTEFYFDKRGSCTASTYSPDHKGLSRMMKTEWLPSGIDMKGFVHSHPGRLDSLSVGDLSYIRRLLLANEDMGAFIAPIVIPREFRMCPIVVLRKNMKSARQAQLRLF